MKLILLILCVALSTSNVFSQSLKTFTECAEDGPGTLEDSIAHHPKNSLI